MASTEADIEMVETFTPKHFDDRSSTQESKSEDDDKDKDPSIGDRNDVLKSDRKIGHRRVGVGGEITYKKIQTTQIMGSIQLGIQHAVGGLASKPERDLLMQDFMTVETTNFPHEGSNHTPAHHYSEFKFKTYAPIAFRYFRDLFGIQPDDFLMSFCSSPLRELSNPGASGSIFYLTEDDEFIIKTVQHKEGEFLQKLLPGYYMNLNQNPRTLLPKFFGLYCYQCNSKNVRLVAMNNLLPSVVKLHQKYDLKGSTYKRKASKSERGKKSPTYKDLDFMEHHPLGLFLEADTHGALVKTIQRDCRVLESFKIMDYSLLVGIHNLDKAQREKAEELAKEAEGQGDEEGAAGERSMLTRTRSEHKPKEDFSNQVRRTQSINRQRLVAHSTAMESIQAESEPIDEEEDVPPGGIPARNEKGERLLLFVGVIDILQSYRFRKKLEHSWKSLIHDGDTVSVHRPSFYAQRFQDFMAKKVFMKIPSPLKHSPSKRKSLSKPQRPLEDLETTGASTSAQVPGVSLTGGAQFPRVLWVDPGTKPQKTPETPIEGPLNFRLGPQPTPSEYGYFLSPKDSTRRFSTDTDSGSSRVPSPLSMCSAEGVVRGFYKSAMKNSDADVFEHNTSTPYRTGLRKISFVIDDEPNVRSPSGLSNNSGSIAEAMKDMPYIDSMEDTNNQENTKNNDDKSNGSKLAVKVDSIGYIKQPDESDGEKLFGSWSRKAKKKNEQNVKEEKGFFSSFKKVLVDLFTGGTHEDANVTEVKDDPKKDASNSDDKLLKTENRMNDDETNLNVIESQKNGAAGKNNLESFTVEECGNDDVILMPYKENCIDIVEDIEVCTNFAENEELQPDLEVTWRNKRIKSCTDGDEKIKPNNENYRSLGANEEREIMRALDENSTKRFLENERQFSNENNKITRNKNKLVIRL